MDWIGLDWMGSISPERRWGVGGRSNNRSRRSRLTPTGVMNRGQSPHNLMVPDQQTLGQGQMALSLYLNLE